MSPDTLNDLTLHQSIKRLKKCYDRLFMCELKGHGILTIEVQAQITTISIGQNAITHI